MQSINFDDGYKSFAINNDENRVIKFNPSDPNLIKRYNESLKNMMAVKDKIGADIELSPDGELKSADNVRAATALLNETDDIIRENINLMFNSDVYDTVFAGQSPFCMVRGNKYLFEAFLMAIEPIIKRSVGEAAAASEKRMDKYLNKQRRKRR
jgi:hypothetical protein